VPVVLLLLMVLLELLVLLVLVVLVVQVVLLVLLLKFEDLYTYNQRCLQDTNTALEAIQQIFLMPMAVKCGDL
jgi:hypothetical protein